VIVVTVIVVTVWLVAVPRSFSKVWSAAGEMWSEHSVCGERGHGPGCRDGGGGGGGSGREFLCAEAGYLKYLGEDSEAVVEGIRFAYWGLCGADDLAKGHEEGGGFGKHDDELRRRRRNSEERSASLLSVPDSMAKSAQCVFISFDDLSYF
jgi:hypothetical protein